MHLNKRSYCFNVARYEAGDLKASNILVDDYFRSIIVNFSLFLIQLYRVLVCNTDRLCSSQFKNKRAKISDFGCWSGANRGIVGSPGAYSTATLTLVLTRKSTFVQNESAFVRACLTAFGWYIWTSSLDRSGTSKWCSPHNVKWCVCLWNHALWGQNNVTWFVSEILLAHSCIKEFQYTH